MGMKRDERVTVMMTPDEVKRIDDWRFANRVGTRSDAIRRMIALVLNTPPPPNPQPDRS